MSGDSASCSQEGVQVKGPGGASCPGGPCQAQPPPGAKVPRWSARWAGPSPLHSWTLFCCPGGHPWPRLSRDPACRPLPEVSASLGQAEGAVGQRTWEGPAPGKRVGCGHAGAGGGQHLPDPVLGSAEHPQGAASCGAGPRRWGRACSSSPRRLGGGGPAALPSRSGASVWPGGVLRGPSPPAPSPLIQCPGPGDNDDVNNQGALASLQPLCLPRPPPREGLQQTSRPVARLPPPARTSGGPPWLLTTRPSPPRLPTAQPLLRSPLP